MNISVEAAQRLAIHAQLLDGKTRLSKGMDGAAEVVEKLGYIQIDTLQVLKRAHHHTLWTRVPDYTPDMITRLQLEQRRIYEYWGHALSYLPISDFRFSLPRMKQACDPYSKWEKEREQKYGHYQKPVLERIRNEGPSTSRDFSPRDVKRKIPSNQRDPYKSALEMLHLKGELMVSHRENFERVYDLTERILPEATDTRVPSDMELGKFLIRRALQSYGIAAYREICDHLRTASNGIVSEALNELLEQGQVLSVTIGKDKDSEYFAIPEIVKKAARLRKSHSRAILLSPFDNLVIQRDRIKRLFGFDYTIECYVPAARRKFGYFVLPILWNEEFVGRLDSKADRKAKTYRVQNMFVESGFDKFDEFVTSFVDALHEFARFNNCERIAIEKTTPSRLKKPLIAALKKTSD